MRLLYVFEKRKQRERPNNGADTTNYILFRWERTRGGPYSVKHIKRRGSNIGIDDP